ncbi:MAG: hypothetical protein LUG99_21795 [Lachnospiraceae bacterium]|nr:hypothetical protein [Lachnospiraceae bacterium]
MRKVYWLSKSLFVFTGMLVLSVMVFSALAVAGPVNPVHASAEQTTGTVEIQLPESASGIELTLYQVGEYENGSYVFTETFAQSGVEISDLNNSSEAQTAAQALAAYAKTLSSEGSTSAENSVSGSTSGGSSSGSTSGGSSSDYIISTVTADASGSVRFDGLPLGLYLIAQTGGTEYLEAQPALIPLPYSGADSGQGWIYDVTIALKYSFPGGAVILTKTDDAGNLVEGAVFVLQQKVYADSEADVPSGAESGTDNTGLYYWKEFAKDLTTSAYGQVVVTGLPTGELRLVETETPEGYVDSYAVVTFTISAAGTVTETDGVYSAASGDVQTVSAVNSRTQVTINKVDEAGAAVAGAKLVIKDADGNVIHKEDGTAKYGITTTTGTDILYGLPAGTYYLDEVTEPDGYKYTADVMFTVSESEGAENTVTMVDPSISTTVTKSSSGSETDEATEGSITVTKELELQDGSAAMAESAVFYVALFSDETCATRVSGVKTITFTNMGSSSVTFEHLDLGTSYYVAETDEYGDVLTSGVTSDDVVYAPEYPDGTTVKLSKKNSDGSITFKNVFYELPSGYYYGGYLTITKKTIRGGEAYDTDDVFYARVFSDSALTEAASDIIELDMGGGSSFSYTIEVGAGTGSGTSETYYVAETDSSGNPLTDTAAYNFTISIDKESVTISSDDSEKTVTITNTFEPDEETEEESDSTVTTTSGGTDETTASSVQTGDETPLGRYLALMLTALVIMLAAGVVWRQKIRR